MTFIDITTVEEQAHLLAYYLASIEIQLKLQGRGPSKEQVEAVEQFSSRFQKLNLKADDKPFDDLLELFSRLLTSNGESIDASGAALVLASLANLSPNGAALRLKLTSAIFSETSFSETRINLLSQLLPSWPLLEQPALFVSLANYAAQQNRASALVATPTSLRVAVAAWNLTPAAVRPVLEAALQLNKTGSNAFELAVWLLQTFEPKDPAAATAAVEAFRIAISSENVAEVERILETPAAASLPKPTLELLELVSRGTVASFQAWARANPSVFSSIAIDEALCLEKVRILSLTSLCRGQTRVAYADIAAALAVDLAAVEPLLLRAVAAGLVEGKLNQLTESFSVATAFVRGFGDDDWKKVQAGLHALQGRFESLLSVVKKQRTKAASRDEEAVPALVNVTIREISPRPEDDTRGSELRLLRGVAQIEATRAEGLAIINHAQEDQELSFPVPYSDLADWYPVIANQMGSELPEDERLTSSDLALFAVRLLDLCREHYWTLSGVSAEKVRETNDRCKPLFEKLKAHLPEIVDAKKKNQLRNYLVHDEEGPKLKWALRLVNDAKTYAEACASFIARHNEEDPREIIRRAEASKVVGLTNIGQLLHQLRAERLRSDRNSSDNVEQFVLGLVAAVPELLTLPDLLSPVLVRVASGPPGDMADHAARRAALEIVSVTNWADLPDVGALYAEAVASLKSRSGK